MQRPATKKLGGKPSPHRQNPKTSKDCSCENTTHIVCDCGASRPNNVDCQGCGKGGETLCISCKLQNTSHSRLPCSCENGPPLIKCISCKNFGKAGQDCDECGVPKVNACGRCQGFLSDPRKTICRCDPTAQDEWERCECGMKRRAEEACESCNAAPNKICSSYGGDKVSPPPAQNAPATRTDK